MLVLWKFEALVSSCKLEEICRSEVIKMCYLSNSGFLVIFPYGIFSKPMFFDPMSFTLITGYLTQSGLGTGCKFEFMGGVYYYLNILKESVLMNVCSFHFTTPLNPNFSILFCGPVLFITLTVFWPWNGKFSEICWWKLSSDSTGASASIFKSCYFIEI